MALVAAKVGAMGLGFVFWLLAARLFPVAAVGTAGAAVSAMMLCTQLAQLGLGSAVIARLPRHRTAPAPLLDAAFALTVLSGLLAAGIALLVAAFALSGLDVVARTPSYAVLFVIATVTGTLTILLDQTATALQRGDHALLRGVAYGGTTVAALALVAIATSADSSEGIFMPWALGGLVGCAIGARQLRAALRDYLPRLRVSRRLARELLRVGGPNHALTLAERVPGLVLPVIVLEVLSPAANAVWYVVWMMAWVVYSVPIQVGMTVFAEVARRPDTLAVAVRRGVRLALLVGGAGAVVLALLGGPLLSALGDHYVDEGTTPLRLLLVGFVPLVITGAYYAICRALGRLREALVLGWAGAALGITVPAAAAAAHGLEAIALAWIAVQALIAVVSAVRLRALVGSHPTR
ncbi:MAG: oligosaccharide flippase family protein [Thermoleophilaceae bacterium]|nr:oligosaccharide flippase family protein [Thermoleophilaceae bacterium]